MAKRNRPVRGRRGKQQNTRIGIAVVAVLLVVAIFAVANRQQPDSEFYRTVNPAELDRVVADSEPVLVYFHSPT